MKRFKLHLLPLILCLLVIPFTGYAQQRSISGTVVGSNGEPLAGVTVTNKTKANATQTDNRGEYLIVASSGDLLEYTYVGRATTSRTVGEANAILVTMAGTESKMDEIVVIGYGTQKRSKITGSVSKLDNKILESGVRSNPAQALAGTIPGVRVSTGSGRPGALPGIVLRGGTHFDGSGSPLVLLDGQVRGSLSDINPDDIESIEVLKDASATSIYGARASNGVILITTKKGKVGQSSVNIKAKRGLNYLNIPYNFLNAEDYIKWTRLGVVEAIKNSTLAASSLGAVGPRSTGNLYFDATGKPLDGNYDTRAIWSTMKLNDQNKFLLSEGWQQMTDPVKTNAAGNYDPNGTNAELIYKDFNYGDYAFKSPATTQDYNIGFQGGNANAKYFANLGYYDEEGLPLETFYRRLNFTANSEYKINNWLTSETGFNFTKANWRDESLQNGESNYWGRMLSAPPTLRGTNADGVLLLGRDNSDGNPAINIDKYLRKNQTDKFTMSQFLRAGITKDLSLRVGGLWFYSEGNNESFNRDFRTGPMSLTNPNTGWNRDRSSSSSWFRTVNETYNAVLNYQPKFNGPHSFDAMVGGEYFNVNSTSLGASGRLAPTDDFEDLDLTLNNAQTQTRGTSSGHSRERIASAFGRVNYDYMDKYLATFTLRADGVSRLAADTRWGTFPGVSVGWVASKEDFLKGITGTMNYLKFRGSWGMNGNIGIGTSNAIGLYEVQGSYGTQTPYNGFAGFLLSGLANPTLMWERSNTIEVGADMGFFNNRLYTSLAFYNRVTEDKLASVNLPISSGIGSNRTNNGSMRNRGFEADLNYRILTAGDFTWQVGANAAWNKNIILKLPFNGNENNRQGGAQIYDPKTRRIIWVGGLQEGQEFGEEFGYVSAGIIRNDKDLASYNKVDLAANYVQYGASAGRKVASKTMIDQLKLTNTIATQLGDMMWKDIDNNDTIDLRDRVSLGRQIPRWTGGLNTTLAWKGLSLFVRTDFAAGHIQQDFMQMWALGSFQGEFNATDIVKQTWTPENPSAPYPRYTWADQLNAKNFDRPSNMFWVNSSYIAIREVTLSYNIKPELLSKIRVKGLQLSATGQNLGYISNKLINLPERTGSQNSAYTIPTSFVVGANLTL